MEAVSRDFETGRSFYMTEEQKRELFMTQKQLLDTFLKTGALTPEQYEKSLTGLKEKMKIDEIFFEKGLDQRKNM